MSRKLYLKPIQLNPATDSRWLACFLDDGEFMSAHVVAWAVCEAWESALETDTGWRLFRKLPGDLDTSHLITGVVIHGKKLSPINPYDDGFLGYIYEGGDARDESWWSRVQEARAKKDAEAKCES